MKLAIGEFWDASALRVSIETTGLRGTGAESASWAEVEFVFLTGNAFETPDGERSPKVLVRVSGDSEISTLAAALEWAGQQLGQLSSAPTVSVQIPPAL